LLQDSPRTLDGPSVVARLRTFFEWQLKKSHQTIADLIYGVDTSRGVVDPVRDTTAPFAYDAATPWSSLRRIFKRLHLDFSRFTFIDMGCGKGRMVLAASAFPFASVIGVEFAPSLCRVAESNLARCRFLRRRAGSTRIIECDAAELAMPGTPCVFFFYNPFDFALLEIVIQRIIDSHREFPREIYLICVGMSTVVPQIRRIPRMTLLYSSSIRFGISDNRTLYVFSVTDN
jgi:SAM-dependent methyltransferase